MIWTRLVLAILFCLLLPLGAAAQTLTPAQRATLKANVLAAGDSAAFISAGNWDGLAALYSAPAIPNFTIWKTGVLLVEVGNNIVASELAGLSSLNATRLQTIALYSPSGINPSLVDRRAFFDDVFSGAGGVNTRARLLILWKRLATRFEKVFATGTGSDASPATLVLEGGISGADLQAVVTQ